MFSGSTDDLCKIDRETLEDVLALKIAGRSLGITDDGEEIEDDDEIPTYLTKGIAVSAHCYRWQVNLPLL